MRRKSCLFTTVLLLTFCSYALFHSTSARPQLPIRNVDTDLEYSTIQAALNAKETLDGHTIHVDSGTYTENVIVNKSISLIGENKFNTIIHGQFPQNIIYVKANSAKIAGFTIEESAYGYSGIYLYRSKGCNITNNIVKNSYHGIHLHNSSNNIIYNNLASGCEYGIRLYSSTSNTISENIVANNKDGIQIDISSNNQISGNNITLNSLNGVYLFQSPNNNISDNTLTLNRVRGTRVNDSPRNTFFNNTISASKIGFHLYESMQNDLFYNIASNNTDGIWFMNSDQNVIRANTISVNSQYGLRLLNSSDNKIFHNNFVNNTLKNIEQPSNTSFGNLWDNSLEGNYWSDQNGIDANKDGINDIPYITDQRTWLRIHSKDNYPLIGPFQYLNLQFQNQSHPIEIISNSIITEARYSQSLEPEKNTLILESSNSQNTSFCRILIPHTLIEPPYTITINNNPPKYNNTIQTNGTHTWIYFEYTSLQQQATITLLHKLIPIPQPPIWTQWPFWELLGLTALAIILSLVNIKYHQMINKQKNLLRLYAEKLQKANPIVIARELFTADVSSRKTKIRNFEEKYGLKIQPRNSFEDVVKSIRSKQEESEESEQ